MKEFKHCLGTLFASRTEDIENHMLSGNNEYHQLSGKVVELQNKIKESLPLDLKHLLEEYESIENQQYSIVKDVIYQQGIRDGIELKQLF